MFLRAQLVARLPVTAIRFCCNSVPSTSSFVSYLSSSSIVLSRCHSHTITSSAPQLARHFGSSLVWVRGNSKDWEEAEEVKGARTKHTDDSNSGDGGKGGPEPIKPVEPSQQEKIKKFIVALVLSFALTSLMFSTLVAQNTVVDSSIPADAPQVDFATFAQKYLKAGEIQKIAFIAGGDKAVGTLHAGAIIDGKPAKSGHVVINYAHPPQQFWADVRKEEAEMGISLAQGVDIQLVRATSGWRTLEFFIGFFILGWLFTQYGRLVAKRIVEERAKKGMK